MSQLQLAVIASLLALLNTNRLCVSSFGIHLTSFSSSRSRRRRITSIRPVRNHQYLQQQKLRLLRIVQLHESKDDTTTTMSLEEIAEDVNDKLQKCVKEWTRGDCKVQVAAIHKNGTPQLGLVAKSSIGKNDVFLSIPYDNTGFTARTALKQFRGVLPESYDSWTGDVGVMALQLINELARVASAGIDAPERTMAVQEFITSWMKSLPHPEPVTSKESTSSRQLQHPILWNEMDQEILQSSSTNKIYRILDDIEEDAGWLIENVFEKDREMFPETIPSLWHADGDVTMPCFSIEGYKWAISIVRSRAVFLDGQLRLMPLLDYANHDDDVGMEPYDGTMGTFGTTKGVKLISSQQHQYKAGDEVFVSYGPKSAADYLLDHGFIPDQCWLTAVAEVTLELDSTDRFYDDKLDILEFETYDQAPMDPVQSFDVISTTSSGTRDDGEPDPAMIQFVRLCQLGSTDAFLLESIFRPEVWEFMEYPVSETNELAAVTAVLDVCENSLENLRNCPNVTDADGGNIAACTKLRESEVIALQRTMEYIQREKEALDLKEYYQERRLKDLGLDSVWSPEDDIGDDLSYGQTRTPGGANYDW